MNNNSLYEELVEYSENNYYPFHMPGHKRNPNIIEMVNPYNIDITEIDGFDNLHNPEGLIKNIMDKMIMLYKTKKSYILINGTTCGILASILSVTNEGDKILIGRNSHKSVYNAAYINKNRIEYIIPDVDENGIFSAYSPESVKEIISHNRDIKAVVITSPTYEGVVSDIKSIADIVHDNSAILIVDEAHGAHLGMHEGFPKSALSYGADIVVQSLHKTLPSMTQTAVLHVNSDRVSLDKVEKYLKIFETSSPSYILMSSVDKCYGLLEERGKELFHKYTKQLENFRKEARGLRNISIMDGNIDRYDSGKIVIICKNTSINGQKLYEILLNKYHLQMEMASRDYVIAMTSICDTDEGFKRLIHALKEIDKEISETKDNNNNQMIKVSVPEKVLESYETDGEEHEYITIEESEGRIAGEYVFLYPPGSPMLVPGEKISRNMINRINEYIDINLNILGLKDGKICVIK